MKPDYRRIYELERDLGLEPTVSTPPISDEPGSFIYVKDPTRIMWRPEPPAQPKGDS